MGNRHRGVVEFDVVRKRLVVCCDGTWNAPDSKHVTNVEKIARTVAIGVQGEWLQQVLYLQGVGSYGYAADRILGGGLGVGLFNNVKAGYRWLALNYEPGDEIFVFGFSRGAYTARSLGGMIARVGLLTREALVDDRLPEAVAHYRDRSLDNTAFKAAHSHDARVTFLGVFDTVGALGVPGAFRRAHQFHDVQLSDAVLCARQALAIDEHRIKFEPALWRRAEDADPNEPPGPPDAADPWVRQVWFRGVHSDVGGGYAETGLSDTALAWMTDEASRRGLLFDPLLATYTASGSPAKPHDSMKPMYRVANALSKLRMTLKPPHPPTFDDDRRVLGDPAVLGQRIASCALADDAENVTDVIGWASDHQEAVTARPVQAAAEPATR